MMKRVFTAIMAVAILIFVSGCSTMGGVIGGTGDVIGDIVDKAPIPRDLQEIRATTSMGMDQVPTGDDHVSESIGLRQGIKLRWAEGVETDVTYQHNDIDGYGDHTNDTIWVGISYPIWSKRAGSIEDDE